MVPTGGQNREKKTLELNYLIVQNIDITGLHVARRN